MLATRVATAVVGIPIIFGLIWLGGWPYAVVAAVVLGVAAAEFAHLWFPWLDLRTLFLSAWVAAFAILARVEPTYVLFCAVAGIGYLGGVLRSLRDVPPPRPSARDAVGKCLSVSAGLYYVGLLGSTIVLLRELHNGRDWVYLALFSTFAVDTAAYFVGRAIGRHKLAPAISPKKTWEGFFGGYAGGLAAVLLLNYFLGLRIDAGPVLLIALTLPVAATLGDLFESWVKRRAGVKDTSELIPGHGGVLDRLDSVLFVFPLVYVVARWVV